MSDDAATDLRDRIDAIEEAFEYMLAYAAQGREREDESEGEGIRTFMGRAAEALDGLHQVAHDRAQALSSPEHWADYLEIVKTDAAKAHTLFTFALSQPSIGSELVDNLNATNHLRTILTDIFLLDSALSSHDSAP